MLIGNPNDHFALIFRTVGPNACAGKGPFGISEPWPLFDTSTSSIHVVSLATSAPSRSAMSGPLPRMSACDRIERMTPASSAILAASLCGLSWGRHNRPRHHDGSTSSPEFKARLCAGDPNCAPITLRDKGVTVHREDVDIPEILFAGSIGVVTAIPVEPYDLGDVGKNEISVRVAVLLAKAG